MVMWYVSKVLGKERVQMLKAIDDFVWGVPLIVLILGWYLSYDPAAWTSDHETATCHKTYGGK